MPAVKGKAKKRKTSGRKKGARKPKAPDGFFAGIAWRVQRLWSLLLTYTAVGLTALAVVVVLMLFAGGYFWNIGDRIENLSGKAAKAMGFSVSRVTVKGAHQITDREIMDALWHTDKGSVLGRSLHNVDAEAARQNIEALGWVRAAAVQKLWPDTIHVSIIERRPQALWQAGGGRFFLIDEEGRKLASVAPTDYTRLPVVSGTENPAQAADILKSLAAREALYARVAAVVSVEGRRFDLRFRNDFTAKLPEENVGEALDRLEGLGAGTGKLAASLDYIDLRDPKWAYYRPKSS